jgi:hypothetical protein
MIGKRLFTAVCVCIGVLATAVLAQSSDPLVGTWKINPAKSTGVKSGTSKIEPAGKGVKFTVDLVTPDGTSSHWEFTANYDGKDVPVTGNSPFGEMASLTRVDAKTVKITNKHNGKVSATSTIVLAADGKTRTTTTKGTDVKGQPLESVSVYEKQ